MVENNNLLNLGVGKLPPDVLEREILSYRGASRSDVLIGPGVGEDAALVDFIGACACAKGAAAGEKFPLLVASSDPIVGANEGAGRLLVHINANDIACKGGDPSWFIVTLIVPVGHGLPCIKRIMSEIDETCRELGIAVIGGHTELTDRYEQPVIVGTMLGKTGYRMDAADIREGDVIIMTRHAGLEGMSIIAADRPDLLSFLSKDEIGEVRSWSGDLSVIPASRCLRDIARVMHDPTEGGVMGGVYEFERMSGLGVEIDASRVPVSPITRRTALALGFDPLRLISSGVLLAALPECKTGEAFGRLAESGIEAAPVGRIVKKPAAAEKPDTHEELWNILRK